MNILCWLGKHEWRIRIRNQSNGLAESVAKCKRCGKQRPVVIADYVENFKLTHREYRK